MQINIKKECLLLNKSKARKQIKKCLNVFYQTKYPQCRVPERRVDWRGRAVEFLVGRHHLLMEMKINIVQC